MKPDLKVIFMVGLRFIKNQLHNIMSEQNGYNAFSSFTLPCGLTVKNRLVKASIKKTC